MLFLSVGQLWRPFATAWGSVALADDQYFIVLTYVCYVIVVVLPLGGWASARKNMDWCFPTGGTLVSAVFWIFNPYRLVQ